MRKLFFYALLISLTALSFSCSSTRPQPVLTDSGRGHYTSSFPTRDVSAPLNRIQPSIKRITTSAFYKTYFFGEKNVTMASVKKYDLNELADSISSIDRSKAGTAITILQNNQHTAFITARHVIAFPDTLISFKSTPGTPPNTFVKSVGIKNELRAYVYNAKKLLPLTIRAQDTYNDLALISINKGTSEFRALPIRLKTGIAKRLRIASFLYVMGYPLGTPMVTRGIVSAPNYDGHGHFLTDGLFNHGISGGIIIATRDNFHSFEWVGIVTQASASEQFFLVPDPVKQQQYSNLDTYSDAIFIQKRELINYGISQATPIESILLFLYSHEDVLNNLGLSSTNLHGQ